MGLPALPAALPRRLPVRFHRIALQTLLHGFHPPDAGPSACPPRHSNGRRDGRCGGGVVLVTPFVRPKEAATVRITCRMRPLHRTLAALILAVGLAHLAGAAEVLDIGSRRELFTD